MLLEAVVAGTLTWVLCARNPAVQRRLLRRWRQAAAVDFAAAATFTREKIAMTSGRNAALLFVSVLEGEVRFMPDSGLVAKVPEPALGEVLSALAHANDVDPVDAIEQTLEKLGQLCATAFPRQAGDQNELPDKPQILLP